MGANGCLLMQKSPCVSTLLDLLNRKGSMNKSELGWVHEMRGRWFFNIIEGFDIIHLQVNSISMRAIALGPRYRAMAAVEVVRTLLP
jgi:hypothetical protein